ncbi:MAG: hypothetical protein HY720_18825 [Planctomycetes bacterium]|nr:hypothetical protein [Planctomycetota bacterium]
MKMSSFAASRARRGATSLNVSLIAIAIFASIVLLSAVRLGAVFHIAIAIFACVGGGIGILFALHERRTHAPKDTK